MATDKDPHVVYLQDVAKALDPSLADEIDEGLVITAREPGGKVRLDDVVNAFRALGRLDEVALVELLSSGQWNIHFPFDVPSADGMPGGELGSFSELLAEDQAFLNDPSDGRDPLPPTSAVVAFPADEPHASVSPSYLSPAFTITEFRGHLV